MGNLPCCNPEEPHKPTAFSSSSNNNNQGFYSTSGIDGKSSSFQNNASNLSSSNALQDGTTSADTNHILSEHSTALDDANKIAMEERQRALLQEKERLQRIVNDASLNMVHVNGSNMRGMNAYYDPGYAADVWQDLIPGGGTGGSGSSTNTSSGRSSSGGLIAKCGQIVPIQVHSVLKVPTMSTSTSSSSTTTRSMEKRLSKPFTLNGVVDREHVLTLKEWLVSHPKSGSYHESSTDISGTTTSVVSTTTTTTTTTAKATTTTTNMTTPSTSTPTETTGGSSEERIELLLDDLTERFMAIILAQQSGRQFDGVDPIVENVL